MIIVFGVLSRASNLPVLLCLPSRLQHPETKKRFHLSTSNNRQVSLVHVHQLTTESLSRNISNGTDFRVRSKSSIPRSPANQFSQSPPFVLGLRVALVTPADPTVREEEEYQTVCFALLRSQVQSEQIRPYPDPSVPSLPSGTLVSLRNM